MLRQASAEENLCGVAVLMHRPIQPDLAVHIESKEPPHRLACVLDFGKPLRNSEGIC